MIARMLLVGFILMCSSTLSRAAEMSLFWEFSSGNWAGGAYKDANGSFSHCYIAASYESGITMAIGITANYDLQLALGKTAWALPVGQTYDVRLAVDGRNIGEFTAIATGNSLLTIHAGNRNDVLARLRRGYELRVTAAQESFYFSLAGTNRALKQVTECVDLAVALSPSRRNPFASGGSETNPFASNTDRDAEDDQRIVESLLAASGLSEPEFFDPRLIEMEGASYAWVSGSVVGAMFVVDSFGSSVDDLSNQILGGIATECDGKYGSQSEASTLIGTSRLKQFSAACRSTTEGDSFFAATAIETGGAVLFLLNFTADQPETVRQVNESLAKVLAVLLTE